MATLEAVIRDDLWRVARARFVNKPHTTVSVVAPGHEDEALPGATLLELQ